MTLNNIKLDELFKIDPLKYVSLLKNDIDKEKWSNIVKAEIEKRKTYQESLIKEFINTTIELGLWQEELNKIKEYKNGNK